MNEVEKMYSNAGVEKEFEKPAECAKNPYVTCDGCMLYDDKRGQCNNKKDYPPFTAEKQLELIKWLAKKYSEVHILNNMARGFAIGIMGVSFNLKKFEEIIAMVLNTFWQDLTEEERKQIKEILEC